MAEKQSQSEETVMLIGIVAMRLIAILYVWLGFAPEVGLSE
jgi:hypothetical protein